MYGLHTIDDRNQLWSDLGRIGIGIGNVPWLISGDFNAILDVQDRINGAPVSWAEIRDFAAFIDDCKLSELRSRGHFYSWHKGGDSTKTASRIDRCLGNTEWVNNNSAICSEYLKSSLSDHCPLLIKCIPEFQGGGRPFKFFNYLADHPNFLTMVDLGWKKVVHGYVMFTMWEKTQTG